MLPTLRKEGATAMKRIATTIAPMSAPTVTGIASEWTPAASSNRPAHAATTTLLITATIPAVVSVSRGNSSGSGVFVRRDGVVITNAHVVRGAQRHGGLYQAGGASRGLGVADVRLDGAHGRQRRAPSGFAEGLCPVSEDLSQRTLALPFFTAIEPEDQERVAEALAAALA